MIRRRWFSLIIPWLILLPLCLAGHSLQAAPLAPLQVNSVADVNDFSPGDGLCETASGNQVCTLRAAIQEAAAAPNPDTIHLPAGTYFLTISGGDDTAVAGDLDISGTTTVVGADSSNTIIDASGLGDRVLQITGTVTIRDLTVRRGNHIFGGGIYNMSGANTVLDHVVITGNVATGSSPLGGGIYNLGNLRLYNSLVISNTLVGLDNAGEGAGIHHAGLAASLLLSNTTVSANVIVSATFGGYGGGVYASSGGYTITHSTISDNSARYGGGISQLASPSASLKLINSTVSGNLASRTGGGIYNSQGTVALFNATVTDNFANLEPSGTYTGGGVYNAETLTFVNSIIAGNHRNHWPGPTVVASDCAGTIISQGNNLVGIIGSGCTVSGPAPVTGNPQLGPLVFNGGPTRTHALRPSSPARDAGTFGGCNGPLGEALTTDQRGAPRPAFGGISVRCDLGAFEAQLKLFLPLLLR